jgi:hypothetical protein
LSRADYQGPERRASTCSEHSEVAAVKGKLSLLLLLLVSLLGLIGYNIHSTMQIQVRVESQVAKIGGQITAASLRTQATERVLGDHSLRLEDHEQRLRILERRRGE